MAPPFGGILRRALEEPSRVISSNAGVEGSIVIRTLKELPYGEGYDARAEEYCNLIERGVVDPAKVTRSAIENAGSIASLLLTTECLVADRPEAEKS